MCRATDFDHAPPLHPRSQVLTLLVAQQPVVLVAVAAAAATMPTTAIAGLGSGGTAIAAYDGTPFPPVFFAPPPWQLPPPPFFLFLFFLQGRKGLKTFNMIVCSFSKKTCKKIQAAGLF